MLKTLITSTLIFAILFLSPSNIESAQLCCKDYGGYVPAAGRAYESACASPCFSPCLAVGFVAIASIVTIVALTNNSGDTGVVIHAHTN